MCRMPEIFGYIVAGVILGPTGTDYIKVMSIDISLQECQSGDAFNAF